MLSKLISRSKEKRGTNEPQMNAERRRFTDDSIFICAHQRSSVASFSSASWYNEMREARSILKEEITGHVAVAAAVRYHPHSSKAEVGN
jgi:hypothetical protein